MGEKITEMDALVPLSQWGKTCEISNFTRWQICIAMAGCISLYIPELKDKKSRQHFLYQVCKDGQHCGGKQNHKYHLFMSNFVVPTILTSRDKKLS
jgi:hypothetical protein